MTSLFLAWQAPDESSKSRAWFPVGRLDAEPELRHYRFRYTRGALTAREEVGFVPFLSFPDFQRDYESPVLFPLFENRVLSPKRSDFGEYISWLGLEPANADPIAVLSVSGGERLTDSLEVFPEVRADSEGVFKVRFFLHGLRHLGKAAIDRASSLQVGEDLRIMVEINNPATRLAITLNSSDYQMIGWAPRYLVPDMLNCVPHAPDVSARVVRINSNTAPLNQRFMIEYVGKAAAGKQPMSTPDFLPLLD